MPLRKFRSIDDMKTPIWRRPGDPALFREMAGIWDVGSRTSRRRYPPGLHKHGSLEEMQLVQATWAERHTGI
jgi:hypothetical protein